ncbi:cation-transporting ATPase [Plakobranchus ocellatus]|uniref:Cation-transporting ATPase n=1 Tax=Plakobranchus ocellatus TaxID=259542 RepID=A0AAV4DRY1_9GAST|nr:cation-transporting ATPase [Plakobranchus ocellatus]
MACANVFTPTSQDFDSDTIIAGSSGSEFDVDLFSDEDDAGSSVDGNSNNPKQPLTSQIPGPSQRIGSGRPLGRVAKQRAVNRGENLHPQQVPKVE